MTSPATPQPQGQLEQVREVSAVRGLLDRAELLQLLDRAPDESASREARTRLGAAVERAMNLAQQAGAKRTLLLPVSVPAHSSLMRAAAQQLSARLDQIEVRAPVYRYISAVDAAEHSEPADIRATLVRQLASPVRWTQTVRSLLAVAPTLIECGPGKVLTGLNRRIERSASCYALEDPESLVAAVAAASGAAAPGAVHA